MKKKLLALFALYAAVGWTAFGIACAYLVQGTGAAINPTFTWTNSATTPGGVIAAVH